MATAMFRGRAGGLAVALGVGAGAVIGLAAQAWAEPGDASRAGTREGSADAGVSRQAAIPRPATQAAAAAPEPAASPHREARRENGPQTASTSRSAKAPGLALPFFPSDPRGRLITIYKGTHFAIPNSFGFFIKEVTGTGTFTANTVYDLKDSDQFDWNKFTGIAFTPLEPDRDSAMVGWRYNLKSEEFEIAPFYNVDKVRILPTPPDIISVPVDETFQYLVDYSGVTLTYGEVTVFKPYPEGLIPNVWTAARVSGWFGGNRVAPRTVSYYLRID